MPLLLLIYALTKSLVEITVYQPLMSRDQVLVHMQALPIVYGLNVNTNSYFECTEIDSYLAITGGLWGYVGYGVKKI